MTAPDFRVAPARSPGDVWTNWTPAAPRPRMLDTASGLPRVMGIATARRLGLSRSAVRHAIDRYGWRPLARGVVLTVRGTPTRADWAAVGLEVAGPSAAVSGWDAVRSYGIGSQRPPDDEVLVLTREGRHRLVSGRVRIRPTRRPYEAHLQPPRAEHLPSLPVCNPARAVADCALRYVTLRPVRAMTTAAIQRGLCLPDELLAELESGPRNDSGWLRLALTDVMSNAHSIAEAEAAEFLTQVDVPAFELNVPILDASGRHVATADALWRELRAVLEVDSREYHFREFEWKNTMRRHNLLTAGGLALTHCPPSQIHDGGLRWAEGIAGWLRARAVELNAPYRPDPRVLRPGRAGPKPYRLPH
ncbi:MAG TPA: hypothetical protein VFT67_07935 [Jatrophihabitantaceae bacterium]|nr:hypothetical protein [Jatrophihabitantaceae bacterium]